MSYRIELNLQQLNTVAAGLNELPRKLSQPVFEAIQAQVNAQDEADRARLEAAANDARKAELEKARAELAKLPDAPPVPMGGVEELPEDPLGYRYAKGAQKAPEAKPEQLKPEGD